MKASTRLDPLLSRYLLDDCSDEERRQVEEQFFASDETFARLCELEEEILERHRLGALTSEERVRFERAYESSPRRDRLLFSRALETLMSKADSRTALRKPATDVFSPRRLRSWLRLESPVPRVALAAAAVVLIALAAALDLQNRRLQSSLTTARAEAERLRLEQATGRQRFDELERQASDLTTRLNRERAGAGNAVSSAPPAPLVLSFVLPPGLLRGADGPKRLVVTQAASELRLQLDLESGVSGRTFRAELRTGAGDVVWSQDSLRTRPIDGGAAVYLALPAALLRAGDYEIELRDRGRPAEDADAVHYYFSVVRR
jgi:hypothetical protein